MRWTLVASLIAAFLTVALAPCPERGASRGGPGATSAPDDAARGELALVASCPCGCEKPPAAGRGSARLGVALPSSTTALAATRPAPPAPDRHARRIEPIASRIEHVPLAARQRIAG